MQCANTDVSCPLFDGSKIGEQPTDLTKLTSKYNQRAFDFISSSTKTDKPFFLYLAYHQTHHPQFASTMKKAQKFDIKNTRGSNHFLICIQGLSFRNTTARGSFGDALAEMDDSIGKIMSALARQSILDNTLIIFTSDNGYCTPFIVF